MANIESVEEVRLKKELKELKQYLDKVLKLNGLLQIEVRDLRAAKTKSVAPTAVVSLFVLFFILIFYLNFFCYRVKIVSTRAK